MLNTSWPRMHACTRGRTELWARAPFHVTWTISLVGPASGPWHHPEVGASEEGGANAVGWGGWGWGGWGWESHRGRSCRRLCLDSSVCASAEAACWLIAAALRPAELQSSNPSPGNPGEFHSGFPSATSLEGLFCQLIGTVWDGEKVTTLGWGSLQISAQLTYFTTLRIYPLNQGRERRLSPDLCHFFVLSWREYLDHVWPVLIVDTRRSEPRTGLLVDWDL